MTTTATEATVRPPTVRASATTNPYPGARSFRPSEHRFFFGRASEVDQLASLVRSQPLILLYAPSGAGKSSLINAGLIPGLRSSCLPNEHHEIPAGAMEILCQSELGNVHPGPVRKKDGWPAEDEVPNVYMQAALDSLRRPGEPRHGSLAEFLAARPKLVDEFGDKVPQLLVFDQFEEILEPFYRDDWLRCRADFFAQLDAALKADRWLHVLIAIREDHLASIGMLLGAMETPLRTKLRIDRLTVENARTAISSSAAESGVPIEERPDGEDDALDVLVRQLGRRLLAAPDRASGFRRFLDRLLRRDVRTETRSVPEEFVDPGVLSVVCRRVWKQAVADASADGRPSTIRVADVEKAGGVEGALERYYDDAIRDLASGRADRRLRRFFEHRLISDRGTRHLIPYDTEDTRPFGIRNTVITKLQDDYGLLRQERRGANTYIELSHDGFVKPVQDANQTVRRRRRKHRNTAFGTGFAVLLGALLVQALAGRDDDSEVVEPPAAPVDVETELRTVPSIVGLDVDEAQQLLSDARIGAQVKIVRSSQLPGLVIEQIPGAGDLAQTVVLSVAAEPGTIVNDDRVLVAPGDDLVVADVLVNDESGRPGGIVELSAVEESDETGTVSAMIDDGQLLVAARDAGSFELKYTVLDEGVSVVGRLTVESVAVEARALPGEIVVAVGSSVEFSDESVGVGITRSWTFDDAEEPSSTERSFVRLFDSPDVVDVRLDVTDQAGTTSSTDFTITVERGPRTATFVAKDIRLRKDPSSEASIVASADDVTGMQIRVDPIPTDGWYRVTDGEWAGLWIFGALIVPQDGDLQVETLDGQPATLVDVTGSPLLDDDGDPQWNLSGRLVLVAAVDGDLYRILLPDRQTAWVRVTEVRILVQTNGETSDDGAVG